MQLSLTQLENTCYRLGISLKAGIPIAQAWEIESRMLRGRTRRMFDGVLGRIRGGMTLADSIAGEKSFPPLLIEMIRVGEETGQLDQQTAEHVHRLVQGVRIHSTNAGLTDLNVLFDNIDAALAARRTED